MIAQKIINESEVLFSNVKNNNLSKSDISHLEKKCRKYLGESNKNLTQIINMFNDLIIEVIKLIIKELPLNEDIKDLNNKLKMVISINYVEPISRFITNIYIYPEYRISLKKGRDDFFMGITSKDMLDKHNDLIDNAEDATQMFFDFKTYWGRLSDNTKTKIKEIMAIIIELTEKYIEIKDDANDVAKVLIKLDSLTL